MADQRYGGRAGSAGIGFGSVLAAVISWSLVKSLGWLILHTIFGWIYVIWKWADGTIRW